jgi:5-methylcytosine-specific restriction endonuclease McrA
MHRITCSRKCSNVYRKGISYKLGRPKDKGDKLRSIKVRLISARGGKCERCGYNKLEILQVHHKDRNRENSNLDNLELLCPNCHFEEHYLEKSWLKNKY